MNRGAAGKPLLRFMAARKHATPLLLARVSLLASPCLLFRESSATVLFLTHGCWAGRVLVNHNGFAMKARKQKVSRKSRAEEKMASRLEDQRRLENGEDPEVIQRENSIFPPGFFEKGRFINLASVVGK